MKKLFWSLLFLIFLAVNQVFAAEEKTKVRVGISNNSFSTYEHTQTSLVLIDSASIIDMTGNQKLDIEPNSIINATISNGNFIIKINDKTKIHNAKGPIVISSSKEIGIKDLKRKGSPAYYKGMIELNAIKPDKFNIINILDMQSYLKGVVPNEMPVTFGLEALKAQAVAARNYANRQSPYPHYDVCDSTACQVYYGANSQTEISDKAVDLTKGIYALYNEEPILALYSSTPGGITESYFNTFGNFSENKPYLKPVQDTNDLTELSDEDFFKKNPPSFDMKSPRYRWKMVFTRGELEDILSKTLFEQSKTGNVTPYFEEDNKITGLSDIKILKKSNSKKVLEIEIKADTGNYIVKKELPIRRVLKQNGKILPSANFIIEKNLKTAELKPKIGVFDDNKEDKKLPESFTFYGAGFGHGVGMSQYGAGYLSSYGVDYIEILKHYYKDITLGTIPKTVSYNDIGLNYTQSFYFSNKNQTKATESLTQSPVRNEILTLLNKSKNLKCFLVIDNAGKVSKAEFYINDHHFTPDLNPYFKRFLKTDITGFLQNGENKITFMPLSAADKKKVLSFYIVLEEDEND